jgi:hypothetical protein
MYLFVCSAQAGMTVKVKKTAHVLQMGHLPPLHLVGFGRPRRRGDDNIKIDLQEERCEDMDWFDLAQERAGGGHL